MFSKFSLVSLIMMITTLSLLAQGSSDLPIESIEFEGLEKTQISFLETMLSVRQQDEPSLSDIDKELQKLKNVASIGNATYQIDTIDNKLKLTYKVEEVRTFLPILNFGGIKGNLWFQLGFTDNNWRGRGQLLTASYQNNDGLHSGQVFFRDPRVRGGPWGYTASLSSWKSLEPLFFPEGGVNYVYNNNSFGITGIRNFGTQRSLEFGGSYFIEKYAKSSNQSLESPPGPDALTLPKVLSKIEYKENYINYDFFYREGHIWNLTYQNVYNTQDKSIFNSLLFQGIKYFRPIEKINLAFRLKLAISTNNNTPFAPFVADSHVNLRGVGNRIDRGTAQVVLNFEYRHTLFHRKYWSSQIVAFSDIGTWRNPGGEYKDLIDPSMFRQFLGGGIRFIYQKFYGAVIRIDYGVDVFNPNQRGIVIGFGQYF